MEIGKLTNGGIYAGEYERKPLILALNDLPKKKTWDEATKSAPKGWRLPNRIEWLIMLENVDKINAALEKHGGKKLEGWYWSASPTNYGDEWGIDSAWSVFVLSGGTYASIRSSNGCVRYILYNN